MYEGNVFSRVCLSLCSHSVPHMTTTNDVIGQSQAPTQTGTIQRLPPMDVFKIANLGPPPNDDPFKLVQYAAKTSVGKRAVGIRQKCLQIVFRRI